MRCRLCRYMWGIDEMRRCVCVCVWGGGGGLMTCRLCRYKFMRCMLFKYLWGTDSGDVGCESVAGN